MSKEKVSTLKKDLRKEVSHQLEISLGKLKEQLGEKKFNSRLKKAVKILTEDWDVAKKVQTPKSSSSIKIPSDIMVAKSAQKPTKAIAAVAPKASAKKAPKAKAANKTKK